MPLKVIYITIKCNNNRVRSMKIYSGNIFAKIDKKINAIFKLCVYVIIVQIIYFIMYEYRSLIGRNVFFVAKMLKNLLRNLNLVN